MQYSSVPVVSYSLCSGKTDILRCFDGVNFMLLGVSFVSISIRKSGKTQEMQIDTILVSIDTNA